MAQMKVREYARHRGVSHVAVLKAIKSGRLDQSVIRDGNGRPVIDSEVADREWTPTTKEVFRESQTEKPRAPVRRVVVHSEFEESEEFDETDTATTYADARLMREKYLAKMAKLEFEERSKMLVPAEGVQKTWVAVATTVKTKVLGIPAKARQRMPEMTHDQYTVLESIVRETLEELASVDSG